VARRARNSAFTALTPPESRDYHLIRGLRRPP
jgi:hypothetical protein